MKDVSCHGSYSKCLLGEGPRLLPWVAWEWRDTAPGAGRRQARACLEVRSARPGSRSRWREVEAALSWRGGILAAVLPSRGFCLAGGPGLLLGGDHRP